MRTHTSALGVAMLLAFATGCQGSPPTKSGTQPEDATSHVHVKDCHLKDPSHCYPDGTYISYCYILQVRKFIEDGKLAVTDLPNWADTRMYDGAPRIIDFRHPTGEDLVDREDQLDPVLAKHGLKVDDAEVRHCMTTTDNADVVRTEGGDYDPLPTTYPSAVEGQAASPYPSPTGPVPTPGTESGGHLSTRELQPYVTLARRFYRDALTGDCDAAWALTDGSVKKAEGPRWAFCRTYLVALARFNLAHATISDTEKGYVTLSLTPSNVIGMSPDRAGRPRISSIAIPLG